MSHVHLSNYQARDYEVVDYHMQVLGQTGLQFRGPIPEDLATGSYFACVGAAQTLGCFCEQPFPSILADALGIPVLNLGYGGAGPEFFLTQNPLHSYLNSSKFVVLQVMSGRSQSNSLYECGGLEYVRLRTDGRKMASVRAVDELFNSSFFTSTFGSSRVTRRLSRITSGRRIRAFVNEIRAAWVNSYNDLIRQISVPIILLWFSKRGTNYQENFTNSHKLMGEYPQLVNTSMVEQIRSQCTDYVEVITSRGDPQQLISRFTGDKVKVYPANDRPDWGDVAWSTNHYYPTPEMHEDAASALIQSCRRLL